MYKGLLNKDLSIFILRLLFHGTISILRLLFIYYVYCRKFVQKLSKFLVILPRQEIFHFNYRIINRLQSNKTRNQKRKTTRVQRYTKKRQQDKNFKIMSRVLLCSCIYNRTQTQS